MNTLLKKRIVLGAISILSLIVLLFSLLLIYQDSFFRLCFTEKVWTHRVNSIEKYGECSTKFYGVEIDLYFDSEHNVFTVTHDLEDATGLTLMQLLSSNDKCKELHYWLDYTNLNEENCIQSLERLNFIVDSLNLKTKSIYRGVKDADSS